MMHKVKNARSTIAALPVTKDMAAVIAEYGKRWMLIATYPGMRVPVPMPSEKAAHDALLALLARHEKLFGAAA